MATPADDLVTLITDYYGDTGNGGTTPANIVNLGDQKRTPPFASGSEYVAVWLPRPARHEAINDDYENIYYEFKVRCASPTSDTRVKEIADEVKRCVNDYSITDVHRKYVEHEFVVTDRREPIHMVDLTIVFEQHLWAIGVAYDGGGSGTSYADKKMVMYEADSDLSAERLLELAADNEMNVTFTTKALAVKTDSTYDIGTTGTRYKKAYLDDLDATAGTIDALTVTTTSAVSDTAYGAGWNGDTTHAPSKNAVYDKIEALGGGGYTQEEIEDFVGAMWTGNTETGCTVTYQDADGTIDIDATQHALADHTSYALANLSDVTITGALLEDALGYGTGNKFWTPFVYNSEAGSSKLFEQTSSGLCNLGATDGNAYFCAAVPATLGSLLLYCDQLKVVVSDGDANDYITATYVYGAAQGGVTTLHADTTDIGDGGAETYTADLTEGTPVTVGGNYDQIVCRCDCVCTTNRELDIAGVFLRVWYA